jgi:hypothetical protein
MLVASPRAVEEASSDADGCCSVEQDCQGAGSSSPRKSAKRGGTGLGNGEGQAQLNDRWHRWARPQAMADISHLADSLREIAGKFLGVTTSVGNLSLGRRKTSKLKGRLSS